MNRRRVHRVVVYFNDGYIQHTLLPQGDSYEEAKRLAFDVQENGFLMNYGESDSMQLVLAKEVIAIYIDIDREAAEYNKEL